MSLVPPSPTLDDFGRTSAEIEAARRVASRRLREAIGAYFVAPATLAAFPGTEEGQELRALVEAHGVAIAAYELTARDGGRSKKVVADAQRAEAWLDDVRSGLVDLSPLARRGATSGRPRQILIIGNDQPHYPETAFDPTLGGRRR